MSALERNTAAARAALFVDGGNTFGSSKAMGWLIDSKKLFDFCGKLAEKDGYQVELSYYFTAYDPIDPGQLGFLDALGHIGYTVISKPIKTTAAQGGIRYGSKGNLDVELALKVMEKERFFSLALIVSGDSDFEPIINHLHATGHLVYILSADAVLSRELRNAGDKIVLLNEHRSELERVVKTKAP